MIYNIITLTLNDLAIAFKNKTIYLVFFIPLFVFLTLKLVDSKAEQSEKINIGLIDKVVYAPVVLQAITTAGNIFRINYVASEEEGKKKIKEKKLDGLLLRSEVLIVLHKNSIITHAIVESFQALQKAAERKNINWISEVLPLKEEGIQKQSLPTWILMLVLLVSFIIIPAQVAEEKEKKLLLALLQTPMREIEWLIAKLFMSMILIFVAVLILHFLGTFNFGVNLSYLAFLVIGSFSFSSYGILLGFLCRNQASARTLGVVFYLPHLLPSALSDFSKKLSFVARLLPSFQFYESIKSILLDHERISNLSLELGYLLMVGIITFNFSYVLMKKRWLM
jgi:ABC-2 type transport system permease protein